MKQKFTTNWKGDMAFEMDVLGHKILMDAGESVGGKDMGPRPKPLIISALTGCTGMDVVSILRKMQVEVDEFFIETETELTSEHPKEYTHFHLIYTFKGKDLNAKKIEKAVKLSQERYCGVSALLSKAVEVTYEIKITE